MPIADAAPRIVYIIVNYQRAQLCVDLARKVIGLPGGHATHVLIVDNSERHEDGAQLAKIGGENISVVTPPANLGFYGGAHFGLTHYLAMAALPDWVIVSNPDIDFPGKNFLTALLEAIMAPDLGTLAPDIRLVPDKTLWSSGVPQNPMMEVRPSVTRMWILEAFHRVPVLYWFLEARSRMHLRRRSHGSLSGPARSIYASHGSAVVFSRNYFERGGSLKHGVFLYGEELFVAEELRLRHLSCRFEPALKLCHIGGATTGALGSRRRRLYCYHALRFIRRRYFSGVSRDRNA